MEAPLVSALAAVLGSLAGGFATVTTAWITQRTTSKRELIRAETVGKVVRPVSGRKRALAGK